MINELGEWGHDEDIVIMNDLWKWMICENEWFVRMNNLWKWMIYSIWTVVMIKASVMWCILKCVVKWQ